MEVVEAAEAERPAVSGRRSNQDDSGARPAQIERSMVWYMVVVDFRAVYRRQREFSRKGGRRPVGVRLLSLGRFLFTEDEAMALLRVGKLQLIQLAGTKVGSRLC